MDYYSLISFILITSITPGPNNISSLSFSLSLGYKGTFRYILGIASGTVIVLLFCAFFASVLSEFIPGVSKYLNYLTAVYIIYLAYKTVLISSVKEITSRGAATFANGALLQLVNPKAIMFGIAIYSTFLSDLSGNYAMLVLSAFMLPIITFTTVSAWALFGTLIQNFIKHKFALRTVTIFMGMVLIWFALKIAGFIGGVIILIEGG